MTTQRSDTGTMLLTVDEAATELRVSRSTVRRLVAAGDLPRCHVGERRSLRIRRDALTRYIDANTRRV